MKKRITNVYDYESYRLLLADDFARRVAINENYSLRAFARDIGISVGFLSKVINNKKQLTPSTGKRVFSILGFSGKELAYIVDLIRLSTTDDSNLKRVLKLKMSSDYDTTDLSFKKGNVPMDKSVVAFITYGLIRKLKQLDLVHQLTDHFTIDRDHVRIAIEDFVSDGYLLKKDEQHYCCTDKDFHRFGDQEGTCALIDDLARFYYDQFRKFGVCALPDNAAGSYVLGYDAACIDEVHTLQKHYILALIKMSERCKNPDRFVFLNTLFVERSFSQVVDRATAHASNEETEGNTFACRSL